MSTLKNLAAVAVLAALAVATPAFAAVTHTGKAAFKITVVTETNAQSTSSTGFVNLPGAIAVVTVPAGKTQLVNVRFSAESYCHGPSTGWCSVRILADGAEMLPNSGSDFAFDGASTGDDLWEGNAMERTLVLGAGTHIITAQWLATDASITFRLDDWTMAVSQYTLGN